MFLLMSAMMSVERPHRYHPAARCDGARHWHTAGADMVAPVCAAQRLPLLPGNLTTVSLFNFVLRNPQNATVQHDWWLQHTPQERIKDPICRWCANIGNPPGCHPHKGPHCPRTAPAYMACSSEPGVNIHATPHLPGGWPMCPQLLGSFHNRSTARPLAFSFGIALDFTFDNEMSALGYEVHSFDPTISLRDRHEAHNTTGVRFHFEGLAGEAACLGSAMKQGGSYGRLGSQLLTLSALRRRHAKPAGRQLRVLKIDCEGCEWEAFWEMANAWESGAPDPLDDVSVLLIEVHVLRALKMQTDADVLMFSSFFRYVFLHHGFRLFYTHVNDGRASDRHHGAHPTMVAHGAHPKDCCYELALARPGTVF